MGESTGASKAPKEKESFIKGLQAEFNKIIWPDQKTVANETITVVVSAVVIGIVIAALDFVIKWGLSFII